LVSLLHDNASAANADHVFQFLIRRVPQNSQLVFLKTIELTQRKQLDTFTIGDEISGSKKTTIQIEARVITIVEIAEEIGRHRSSLSRVARRLGIQKTGRDYLLTKAQAKKVIAALRDRPGNPNLCD